MKNTYFREQKVNIDEVEQTPFLFMKNYFNYYYFINLLYNCVK